MQELTKTCPILKKRARSFITKKSLGQNFLISDLALDIIASHVGEAANNTENAHVLEIGPGIGFLTDKLIATGHQITAIDYDRDALKQIPPASNLKKINQDILQFDFASLSRPLIIVGNLPFNIASKILSNIIGDLEDSEWTIRDIPEMILMFQYEVACRITAKPGDSEYNAQSIIMNAKAKTELLLTVPRIAFWPEPKVKAGVVRVKPQYNNQLSNLSSEERKQLKKIIKIAFSQRRKIISNSLKPFISSEKLQSLNIPAMARPQELSLEQFIQIMKAI